MIRLRWWKTTDCQSLQYTFDCILRNWRLSVARVPLYTVSTNILLLGESDLDQMYYCLDYMVSKKSKDNEMQETTRQLKQCVKAQVNKLQNRVAAKVYPVVPLPIGQHLSFAMYNLTCVVKTVSSYTLHRLKKFAAVTNGPYLVCAVKLIIRSAAHGTTFRQFAAQLALSRLISDDYGRPTYG